MIIGLGGAFDKGLAPASGSFATDASVTLRRISRHRNGPSGLGSRGNPGTAGSGSVLVSPSDPKQAYSVPAETFVT